MAGTTMLSAPSDFIAQYLSGATQLTWNHSGVNVDNIVVQRSTDGVTWTTLEEELDPTESTFEDASLSSGRYYYRVYLTNGLIDSAPSYVQYVDVP